MRMTEAGMGQFIARLHRAELDDNPQAYCKAVLVTLEELGYDRIWLHEIFQPQLEAYYWDEGDPR